MDYIISLLLGLSLPLAVLSQCQSQCPDGWVTFRGSCYFIFDNVSVDWTEATHHCQATHGSHLLILETQDEDSFIRDQIERMYRLVTQRPGQEFWLGATDQTIEGVWTWYGNDDPLSNYFTNWFPGQPASDGGIDEDCAVIAERSGVYNGWHDAPCSAAANWGTSTRSRSLDRTSYTLPQPVYLFGTSKTQPDFERRHHKL